jgi:hypothetical protein
MPLAKIPFKELEPLLKKHLSKQEEQKTSELIKKLRAVKQRGYLRKSELIEICHWKSDRSINLICSNPPSRVVRITKQVFGTQIERKKFKLLTTGLSGVDAAMASSILMLTNPKNYGVIDIRAWQLLYEMRTVNANPRGKGFTFNQWYRYLKILQYFARKFKVKARDIERTLYEVHQLYQKGKLYDS